MKNTETNIRFIYILFFLLIASAIFSLSTQEVKGDTWNVTASPGSGNFSDIYSAVNGSNASDTIYIDNGTYIESMIYINKSLNLIGNYTTNTWGVIIFGTNNTFVLNLTANMINLTNISIMNASSSVIYCNGSNVKLDNCHIAEGYYQGFQAWNSSNITINNSCIAECMQGGEADFSTYYSALNTRHVTNFTLSNTIIWDINDNIHTLLNKESCAVRFRDSNNISMTNTIVYNCSAYIYGKGFDVWTCYDVNISDCYFNNTDGQRLFDVYDSFLSNNSFYDCSYEGVYLGGVYNCTFFNNVFINTTNAFWSGVATNNFSFINNTAICDDFICQFNDNAYFVLMMNNYIESTTNNGIEFFASASHNVTIQNNTIHQCVGTGIHIANGVNHTRGLVIRNNTLWYNTLGMEMDATAEYYVLIYNNYFNNTNNLVDGNGVRQLWNLTPVEVGNIVKGYWIGGNYWHDYYGKDTDGDGLGNQFLPYTCGGEIVYGGDYCPLIYVYNPYFFINITIYNESEIDGVNYPINLSEAYSGINSVVIYYGNKTDTITFENFDGLGVNITSTFDNITYSDNSSGHLFINVSGYLDPQWIEVRWNGTVDQVYYCTRKQIYIEGQEDYAFYVRTDLPVYGETTEYYNESLVRYTLSFIDETALFTSSNNPKAIFFIYNSSGEYQVIHSEPFDVEGVVHPMLVYGNSYFFGVTCDALSIPRIGVFYASSTTTQTDIRIPYQMNITYSLFDLVTLRFGWSTAGLYIHYKDTTGSTTSLEITLYHLLNSTNIPSATKTILYDSNYNYSWNYSQGCVNTTGYKFIITIILSGLIDTDYEGEYSTGFIPIYPINTGNISNASIDSLLSLLFGGSPVYSNEKNSDTGVPVYVPWLYLVIFGISFILLVSFGRTNAFMGGLAVGVFLFFMGSTVTGITRLYRDASTGNALYGYWFGGDPNTGPYLLVIATFITVLSIVGLIGRVER